MESAQPNRLPTRNTTGATTAAFGVPDASTQSIAASSAPPSTLVHHGQYPFSEMMRVSSRSASSGRSPSSSTRWVSALRSPSCRRSRLSSDPVSIIIVSGRSPGGAYCA